MGALRNFASCAAYSTMASLPGTSVILSTIQSISGGGWLAFARITATGHCAFSAGSVAVEPKIERA